MPRVRKSSSYAKAINYELTGGTKDVNPQWFNMYVANSVIDGTHCQAFPIPIQRLKAGGKAQVMEILKVFWASSALDNAPATGFKYQAISAAITTRAMPAGPPLQEPTLIDLYNKNATLNATGGAAPAGTVQEYGFEIEPAVHDLTDGAGHGILVATDNLFLTCSSFQTGQITTASAKVLYRWKDVSMTEYVGIVQGQQ